MEEEECILFHRPHQLLIPSEDRTNLALNAEALAALKSLTGPIVLVCIVGTQRGGKSTLLNLMHSRQTAGFGLGHYMDAQTTGFWMWARRHPRNKDLTILLMDTEGLDTPHIPQFYNWTLAALALLCSTYFIYQSKGSIDSSATDRLGVILQVAEQIGGKESFVGSPNTAKKNETDKPDFLWLIRDHHLSFGGKEPKDEMMRMLDRTERRRLEDFFENYDCVPLPRPVDSDDLLKEVERMKFEDLKTEFREEYLVLERQIFQRKLIGQTVSGTLLGTLFEKYILAVSAKGILDDLSQLPTQKELIFKMKGEKAAESAIQSYIAAMTPVKEKLPVPDLEIFTQHKSAYETAKSLFLAETGGEADEIPKGVEEYFKSFDSRVATWLSVINVQNGECVESKKLVSGIYSDIIRENADLTREKCFTEIRAAYSQMQEKMKDIPKNFKSKYDFERDLEQVKTKYFEATKKFAPSKQVAEEFFSVITIADEQTVKLALLQQEIREELEAKNNKQKEETLRLETEMRRKNEEISSLCEKLDEKLQAKLKEVLNDVDRNKLQAAQETAQKLQEQETRTSTKIEQIQASLSSVKEQIGERFLELKTTIADHSISVKEQASNLQGTFNTLVSETKANLEQQLRKSEDTLTQKIQDSEKRRLEKDKELKDCISEVDSTLGSRLSAEVSKLTSVTEKLSEGIASASQRHDQLQQSLTETKNTAASSLKEVEQKLDEEVASFQASLDSHAKKTCEQFAERAKDFETHLTQSVTDVTQKISENVASLQALVASNRAEDGKALTAKLAELREQLNSLEASSTQRITAATGEITQQMDSKHTEIEEKLKQVRDGVTIELAQFSKVAKGRDDSTVARIEELKKDLEGLQAARERLESSIETHSSDISGVAGKAQTLSSQVEGHTASLEELKKTLQENSTSIYKKESAFQDYQAEMKGVVDEIKDNFKESQDGTAKLSSSISELSTKLEKQTSDVAQIQTAVSQLNEFRETSQSVLDNAVDKETLISGLREHRESVEVVNAKVGAVESNTAALVTELANLKTQYEATAAQLTELRPHVETSVAGVSELRSHIETSFSSLQPQLQHSTSELSELKATIQSVVQELTGIKESAQASETGLSSIQPHIAELLAGVEALKSELGGKASTGDLAEVSNNAQAANSIIAELKTQIATAGLPELKNQVVSVVTDFTNVSNSVQATNSNLAELKTQVSTELTEINNNVKAANSGLAELKTQVNGAVTELAQLAEIQTRMQAAESELSALTTQLGKTGADLSELKSQTQANASTTTGIQEQVFGVGTKLTELRDQLQTTTTGVSDLREKLQAAVTEVSYLKIQAAHNQNAASENPTPQSIVPPEEFIALQAAVQSSTNSVQELRNQAKSSANELEDLRSKLAQFVQELAEIRPQLQQTTGDVNALQSQVESLAVKEIAAPITAIPSPVDSAELDVLREALSSLQLDTEQFKAETRDLIEGKLKRELATVGDGRIVKSAENTETDGSNLGIQVAEQGKKFTEFSVIVQGQLDKFVFYQSFAYKVRLSEQVAIISQLEEGFQALSKTAGETTVSLNHLHIATKTTFVNVEKSMGSLQRNLDSVCSHGNRLSLAKVKRYVETVSASGVSAGDGSSGITSQIPMGEDLNTEIIRKELMTYTDKALEGVVANLGSLARKIEDQYTALNMRIADITPHHGVGAGASPADTSALSNKVMAIERSIIEIRSAHENLIAMIQTVQMSTAGARTEPAPSILSTTAPADPGSIQNLIDEEMINQRKQLVAATRTHVNTVAEELRKEMDAVQQNSKALLKTWEERIQTGLGMTPRGQSMTPGNFLTMDDKLERTRSELENTKHGIEAIWASIAQLSAKLVDLESELDKK